MVRRVRLGETAVRAQWRSLCGVLLLALLPLLLFACRSTKGPAEYLYREAEVESVEVLLQEMPPGGASAVVRGVVPEACTEVDEIRQDYLPNSSTFVLTLTTRRPVEAPCVQSVTPFEATVPLAIERLPDGVYTVVANGVTSTFRLERSTQVPIL